MDTHTRERWALRYAVALETGDLDAVGPILDAAATDPLLAEVLGEIDRQTADEVASAAHVAPVVRLAHAHLHHDEPDDHAVLTVGRVAAQLAADPSTPEASDPYTKRLLTSPTPLPGNLSAENVGNLLHEVAGEPPSARYRSAFRSAAVRARMQDDAHRAEQLGPALMAARAPQLPTRRS